MKLVKVGELYINLDQATYISTSEYNPEQKSGRILVRFSGEKDYHAVLVDADARRFLQLIDKMAEKEDRPFNYRV